MRVLFYLLFPGSGIGRYTHELLTHLSTQDDVDAELACLPTFHWLAEAEYKTWTGLREIGHSIAWRRRLRFLTAQFANPQLLCRRIDEQRADIVHFSNINHFSFPFWRRALDATGVKVVATVHDVRRQAAMVNRRYETHQLKNFYRRADALFVHSQAQADDLAEFAGINLEKLHVVPHGPYDYGLPSAARDTLRNKYGLPLDKQIALFFGNIRDEKNLTGLLKVLPVFRENLHLVVAGRAGAKGHCTIANYQALSRSLEISDSVTFIDGYIPDCDIPDLFQLCDWVALPYREHFTSQSGVLNVAAQYKRPVLVSSAPTFIETLNQCDIGVVTDADDAARLKMGVEEIMNRIQSRYEHAFEEYITQFGWEENAARTIEVYSALCGTTSVGTFPSTNPESQPN
ncbi:glycosyltransferase [Symmachiella macrocystis]|nr:glycosyltransferase [Symmachiella macrocystis]